MFSKLFCLIMFLVFLPGCQTLVDRIKELPEVPCPPDIDPEPGAMCRTMELPTWVIK